MKPSSAGEQLLVLLDKTGISQRELGKRLTELQGKGNERFERRWKAQTRYIQKLVSDPEMVPGRKKLDAIETATAHLGYFKPSTRPATLARRAKLEAEVVYLTQALKDAERFGDYLLTRLEAVEAHVGFRPQPELAKPPKRRARNGH